MSTTTKYSYKRLEILFLLLCLRDLLVQQYYSFILLYYPHFTCIARTQQLTSLYEITPITAQFVDIKGAYNTVYVRILAQKLNIIGIPSEMVYKLMKLYFITQVITQINGERN